MKPGDIVMFTDTGPYAKWFFGQLAEVVNYTHHTEGRSSCRVKWLEPVKYFDSHSTISDFSSDKFEVC